VASTGLVTSPVATVLTLSLAPARFVGFRSAADLIRSCALFHFPGWAGPVLNALASNGANLEAYGTGGANALVGADLSGRAVIVTHASHADAGIVDADTAPAVATGHALNAGIGSRRANRCGAAAVAVAHAFHAGVGRGRANSTSRAVGITHTLHTGVGVGRTEG